MTRFTFSRQERLSSLKEIETLFSEGHSLMKYPLRIIWREYPDPVEVPVRVLISVSKKKFSKAVDRNRVKRLIRESYRLLKPVFYEALPADRSFQIGLIYVGKEILDFETIQKGLSKALERLITQIRQE